MVDKNLNDLFYDTQFVVRASLRRRVAAAFFTTADRLASDHEAEVAPPIRPPLRAAGRPVDSPRPDP